MAWDGFTYQHPGERFLLAGVTPVRRKALPALAALPYGAAVDELPVPPHQPSLWVPASAGVSAPVSGSVPPGQGRRAMKDVQLSLRGILARPGGALRRRCGLGPKGLGCRGGFVARAETCPGARAGVAGADPPGDWDGVVSARGGAGAR